MFVVLGMFLIVFFFVIGNIMLLLAASAFRHVFSRFNLRVMKVETARLIGE